MRLRILVLSLLLLGSTPLAAQPQPPPGFVPVEDAPLDEQIPAMPLLGAAYGFIWVGLLAYVWSIARRLKQVEAELGDLESRKK
jgi:CcmD family protein